MKTIALLLTIIPAAAAGDGRAAIDRLAAKYNAQAGVTLYDGTQLDLLTPELAVDVAWAADWREAIGTALFCATLTGRRPAVLLVVRDREADREHLLRCQVVCAATCIEMFVEPEPVAKPPRRDKPPNVRPNKEGGCRCLDCKCRCGSSCKASSGEPSNKSSTKKHARETSTGKARSSAGECDRAYDAGGDRRPSASRPASIAPNRTSARLPLHTTQPADRHGLARWSTATARPTSPRVLLTSTGRPSRSPAARSASGSAAAGASRIGVAPLLVPH